MIRKAFKRAAVMTAGAGLVLAPMSLMGPQLTLAACQNPGGNYPQGINSRLTMSLENNVVRYGDVTASTAKVTSPEGTPEGGSVSFYANDQKFASQPLDGDGEVSAIVPRGLQARKTHTIAARYFSDCPWNNSNRQAKGYTVYKANTTTNPGVRNGRKAQFNSGVSRAGEGDGFNPQGGRMTFNVRRQGQSKVIRSQTVGVRNGSAGVDMANLRNGSYTIQSRYLGSGNHRSGGKTESFQVS